MNIPASMNFLTSESGCLGRLVAAKGRFWVYFILLGFSGLLFILLFILFLILMCFNLKSRKRRVGRVFVERDGLEVGCRVRNMRRKKSVRI